MKPTPTHPKPTHGAPRPQNVPSDMVDTPPIPCDFKVGDAVIYTNDYGVQFDQVVRGFAAEPHGPKDCPYPVAPRFIYTHKGAWWFPVSAESLRHRQPQAERGRS